ncbi:putative modified peptide [Tahibacter aquaticus]|jgi:putative modified peptide|uniref:Putative modified peptide n=1 Tax=Tahibacter aquaticus TaxID=520092 RepID=A0A4R6YSS1_9GAMM|nr:NHLP-related RiPP peptide [Tahibacter aquaticus]TDR41206.1 putative modified peptide [Tahibacter aquaticus]
MANELNPQQVETLLGKLANDDDFRSALQKDPATALQSIGLPAALAPCFAASDLPDKAAARNAADTLRAGALTTLGQVPHNLVRR